MAKRGRKYKIHGAFSTYARAKRACKGNAWIIKRRVRGDTRYVVLSEKKK